MGREIRETLLIALREAVSRGWSPPMYLTAIARKASNDVQVQIAIIKVLRHFEFKGLYQVDEIVALVEAELVKPISTKRCENCNNWTPSSFTPTGVCNSENVRQNPRHSPDLKQRTDLLLYHTPFRGYMETGNNFGCVHHTEGTLENKCNSCRWYKQLSNEFPGGDCTKKMKREEGFNSYRPSDTPTVGYDFGCIHWEGK